MTFVPKYHPTLLGSAAPARKGRQHFHAHLNFSSSEIESPLEEHIDLIAINTMFQEGAEKNISPRSKIAENWVHENTDLCKFKLSKEGRTLFNSSKSNPSTLWKTLRNETGTRLVRILPPEDFDEINTPLGIANILRPAIIRHLDRRIQLMGAWLILCWNSRKEIIFEVGGTATQQGPSADNSYVWKKNNAAHSSGNPQLIASDGKRKVEYMRNSYIAIQQNATLVLPKLVNSVDSAIDGKVNESKRMRVAFVRIANQVANSQKATAVYEGMLEALDRLLEEIYIQWDRRTDPKEKKKLKYPDEEAPIFEIYAEYLEEVIDNFKAWQVTNLLLGIFLKPTVDELRFRKYYWPERFKFMQMEQAIQSEIGTLFQGIVMRINGGKPSDSPDLIQRAQLTLLRAFDNEFEPRDSKSRIGLESYFGTTISKLEKSLREYDAWEGCLKPKKVKNIEEVKIRIQFLLQQMRILQDIHHQHLLIACMEVCSIPPNKIESHFPYMNGRAYARLKKGRLPLCLWQTDELAKDLFGWPTGALTPLSFANTLIPTGMARNQDGVLVKISKKSLLKKPLI